MTSNGKTTAVRGGRVAQNHLLDAVKRLDDLTVKLDLIAAAGDEHFYRNLDLAKARFLDIRSVAQTLRDAIGDLRLYVNTELATILQRRDAAGTAEAEALQARLVSIEARLAGAETRLAHMEERQAAPGDTSAPRQAPYD
jgi:hypothetical protein